MTELEQSSLAKAKAWANNSYFLAEDRQDVQNLIDTNNLKEIVERFYKDLEFGTGGLRSIIRMGDNGLNHYTIRRASQALATYVNKASTKKEKRIAISYDSRRFSFEFAQTAAGVFAANGIHAYIYKNLNPVALLSHATRYLDCSAGIMVTASHNPPEYNGYKVFWGNGTQVTPPHDQNIITEFYALTDWNNIKNISFDEGIKKGLIHWIEQSVEDVYYKNILEYSPNREYALTNGSKLKIAYTPIHGAGLIPCTRALKELGFSNVLVVEEQAKPDGRFPTVKSPNPENPSALKLVVDLMKKENCDIAFGSDPDTDRLGVAFDVNGETQYLNGNQIGTLMLYYILKIKSERGEIKPNSYFVKTIVTTDLQTRIANKFGVKSYDTLTGFKWICGKMNELEETDPTANFVFGTEESFGYLNHPTVRDKDGVSSVTLMAEMTLWYKLRGMNLIQALDEIYTEFGFAHESLLSLDYFGKEGAEKIQRIMHNFRTASWTNVCGQKVVAVYDYETKVAWDTVKNTKSTIDLPKSNVIGLWFENGSKLYLRPSGTEPKIKFYIMMQAHEGTLSDKKSFAAKVTEDILKYLNSECEKA